MCLLPTLAYGEHIAGANISYRCSVSNFYYISLDLYASCATSAIVGAQTLRFHNECGVFFDISGIALAMNEEVSPVCASQLSQTTCSPGGTLPGYRHYRFTTPQTYLSPCNYWTIKWTTCCRDNSENIQNTPGIHAEATLNNMIGPCDTLPQFADHDVPFVCVNSAVSYNPGASDPNGNMLLFSLITARYDSVTPVLYEAGYSATQPLPGISIQPINGQLYFTPTVTGRYVVVIRVNSYSSSGQLIGSVMRDLMFFVIACDGSPPLPAPAITVTGSFAATGTSSVALCGGHSFCAHLEVTDANPGTTLEITSNATSVLPGSTFTVTGTNPATARICWTANSALLPANVHISISDGACPIANVASSSIYLGDCALLPVELLDFSARPIGSAVLVEWSTASETDNDHFQIERGADGTAFGSIGRVEATGVSSGLVRYSFRDDVPLGGTSYYRLRQVDRNGAYTFGPVASVLRDATSTIHAVRNPTQGWSILGLQGHASLVISDAIGRILHATEAEADGTLRVEAMDDHGFLIVNITSESGRAVLRLPPNASGGTSVAAHQIR